MKFEFVQTEIFEKELKRLSKKYKSLKNDIEILKTDIEKNEDLGINLGDGFKKIRIRINSKGKGKSGGGRVITQTVIVSKVEQRIIMVFLWDKSEIENVDLKILKQLL